MTLEKNPDKIKKLFDEISPYYDFLNNIISFFTHYLFKIIAIKDLKIKNNSKILDLACGSGDITKIISKISPNTNVIGLDFSSEMLKIARKKNPNKKFILGDATDLKFGESEFDYITIFFGLRNIQNRTVAISEIYRVLKNGGLFLHFDFGEDNLLSKIFDFTTPILAKLFCKNKKHYKYLIASKKEYPKPDELIKEFKNTGFSFVSKKYFLYKTISYQIMKKQTSA